MEKKYIVALSDAERAILENIVKTLKGSGQKVKRKGKGQVSFS